MTDRFQNFTLDVNYNKDSDILYLLINGRTIATSGEVSPGIVVDFGSEDDGFDVVGFELHKASEHLEPLLNALGIGKEVYGRTA